MKPQIHNFTVFLFCCSLLWIEDANASSSFHNVTDQEALLQVKKSVAYDPHGVFNSWNMSAHFCAWVGVTCSTRHLHRVTALELEGRSLRGSIPPHIGNLSFLKLINLDNNSFFGKIPPQVGRLRRLQRLRLANNTLEGEIPSLINCSEIRIVGLMGNKLVGVIPAELGSLPKLEKLQVSMNNLKGGVPTSLGNVSTLRFFSAGFNNLVGSIPDVMGRLKNLEFFAAHVNHLSGAIPPSVYNLSSADTISLGVNNLSGTLPLNFGDGLHRLERLGIAENQLSGLIPASLSNASRLQFISLSSNNFEGQIPTSLGRLLELKWLVLGTNHLGSNSSNDLDVLAHLANCSKLEYLHLGSNNLGGTLPNSVGNLSNQLSYLHLASNHIHGYIPGALENLVNLITFSVDDNALTGAIPEYFGKFANMQILFLDSNRFSGKIPISLGNLTQLSEIYLSRNRLEGSVPLIIEGARNLQVLDFSGNRLSGEIPRRLFSLSQSIQLLYLSQNALTGSLPTEVGNLKNINQLDLSSNNLSGEIPTTIGDCIILESLYLQGNSFDKNLPSSLASLKGLVNLDLSDNNLSGEIPKKLSNLRFLLYLNLSFNDLEGEVPNMGIFQNTSAVSVVGNSKLCGGVAELQLPTCPNKELKVGMSRSHKLIIIIFSVVAALFLLSSLFLLIYKRKSQRNSSSTQSELSSLPQVSYQILHRATNGFSPSMVIGAGSFGVVYKGILEQEQNEVAIKVLNLQAKGASKSFVAECNVLKTIRHRNLVKILTCCSSLDHKGNEFKALVFEYMPNGSLDKWLHPEVDEQSSSTSLNLIQRLDIAIDVSCALSYLHEDHEQLIIHCDLKPSNILLDNEMLARVNDFGLARLISASDNFSKSQTSTMGIKGTIGYAAPEYAMGGEASSHGDVYSFGILILEMLTGKRPTDEILAENLHNFVKMGLPEKLEQIVDPTLVPRSQTSFKLRKCLISVLSIGLACSVQSPKERMNMGDVTRDLQHIKNAYIGVGIHVRRERTN